MSVIQQLWHQLYLLGLPAWEVMSGFEGERRDQRASVPLRQIRVLPVGLCDVLRHFCPAFLHGWSDDAHTYSDERNQRTRRGRAGGEMEGGDQGSGWREENTSSEPSGLRALRVSVSLMIQASKPLKGTHVLESRKRNLNGEALWLVKRGIQDLCIQRVSSGRRGRLCASLTSLTGGTHSK